MPLAKIATGWRVLTSQGAAALLRVGKRKFDAARLQAVVRYIDPARPLHAPGVVQIEVSSACNLRCPSCSLSREVTPVRNLSAMEFQSILDRLPYLPPSIALNGIGEPLVNPVFFELVDILGARSTHCSFYTNGTMLTTRVRGEILRRENITFVGISCDGATRETFEALRVGAKFAAWKAAVRDFVSGAAHRRPRPIGTSMSCVLSRRNLAEVAALIDLSADLGFRSVRFSDIVRNDPAADELALTDDECRTLDQAPLIQRGRDRGVHVAFNLRRASAPPIGHIRCFQPWEYAMVSAEGDILPCCAVVGSNRAKVMGNVLRDEFAEIWRGASFREFRRSAADGTNDLCRLCPFY